jgi:hypothetical protein
MDYTVAISIGTEQYIYYNSSRKDAVARILRDLIFLVGENGKGTTAAQLEKKSRDELKAMAYHLPLVGAALQKFVKEKWNKFEIKWANLLYKWEIRKMG